MATLIQGGTIVTMDPDRRILRDAGLVLVEDRIAWLGDSQQVPDQYRTASRIDASGKVVYPGLVNIHTHAALSILRGVGDDLGIAPAYSPHVPQGVYLSPDDCYILSLLGGLEALKFGTTCIVDNYIHAHEAARAFDTLGLRAVVSERLHDADLFQVPDGIFEFDRDRGETLLAKGLALIEQWDGVSNRRIRCRLGPHAPDTCSTELLQAIQTEAERHQVGLVIHLAQSRRELLEIDRRTGKTPTAYLANLGLLGPQMIAGHCIYMTPGDIELLYQTQTHVSHQSGSNAKGGMMAPIKTILEKGINVGLGTDNMAGDMIEVMRLAVCIARMLAEEPVALRAIEALEMATINGAKALGMAEEIGSIEVGKKADLILVDYRRPHLVPLIDPVANLVHNGLGSDVDTVIVDGQIVVEGGQVQTIDELNLLNEAQAVTEARWAEMTRR